MPGLTIRRNDFHLGIAAEKAGKIGLTLRWNGSLKSALVRADDVLSLQEQSDPRLAADLLAAVEIAPEYAKYRASVPQRDHEHLNRVTLQIDEPRVTGLPWELFFFSAAKTPEDLPIVRLSAARPRVAQVPFTFPLRFLQLGNPEISVEQHIRNAFGGINPGPETVRFAAGDALDFADASLPADWPTVDVVHMGPDAMKLQPETVMRTADPKAVGTLGWLMRVSDTWRARLIVLEPSPTVPVILLRRLAGASVGRGGPAVLIGPISQRPTFFEGFYNALIHDNPLDQALEAAIERDGNVDDVILFAGSGREELIRVSAPGEQLNEIAAGLNEPDPGRSLQATTTLREIVTSLGEPSSVERRFGSSRIAFDIFRQNWPHFQFNLHETGGFIPLARHVEAIRTAMRPPSNGIVAHSTFRPPAPPAGERFVNPGLWSIGADATTQRIDPGGSVALKPGAPVVLGIEVGPKDITVTTIGAQALFEEPFRWDEGHEGVWLTVGLSGIDFDVLGAPVQEFWLPRAGNSERIEFTVVPRSSGALLLRFCLYFGADLLQSYRLAAISGDNHPQPSQRRAALAGLMGATEETVPDATYMARLEYAATADLSARRDAARPHVALSIFANDIGGREVITTRSKETFNVLTENLTSDTGKRIRALLEKHSSEEVGTDKRYAFRYSSDGYTGSEAQVDAALRALAAEGWDLYSTIFDAATRDRLKPELAAGNTIHVGHALLSNSLPWALVYDRAYDAERKRVDGQTAQHTTCFAGLRPGQAGLPPACRTHEDCPLNPTRLQAQRAAGGALAAEDTVVCPRHFWGFRHQVELPPMQVDAGKTALPETRDAIAAADPAALMIGYNGKLPSAVGHLGKLKTALATYAIRSAVKIETSDRDKLKESLTRANAALVYLFCHARGGLADPAITKPYIELQGANDPEPGKLYRADFTELALGGNPLVFFNGCNTAAFSPDALSPLIEAVVRDSGASGAIGTEIPVYEDLAAEFALLFLRRFLAGDNKGAGAAMLESRLEMLGRLNPLGIAYTLYGFNNLNVTQVAAAPPPSV